MAAAPNQPIVVSIPDRKGFIPPSTGGTLRKRGNRNGRVRSWTCPVAVAYVIPQKAARKGLEPEMSR